MYPPFREDEGCERGLLDGLQLYQHNQHMTSRLCLQGICTLLNAIVELVICGEEINRGADGGIVRRDGLDQSGQGGFNSIQLALKNSFHEISELISHVLYPPASLIDHQTRCRDFFVPAPAFSKLRL